MSTKENNKLIAKFMDTEITNNTKNILGSSLKYHSSWDWLMPVIEKIESLNFVIDTISTPTVSGKW